MLDHNTEFNWPTKLMKRKGHQAMHKWPSNRNLIEGQRNAAGFSLKLLHDGLGLQLLFHTTLNKGRNKLKLCYFWPEIMPFAHLYFLIMYACIW